MADNNKNPKFKKGKTTKWKAFERDSSDEGNTDVTNIFDDDELDDVDMSPWEFCKNFIFILSGRNLPSSP